MPPLKPLSRSWIFAYPDYQLYIKNNLKKNPKILHIKQKNLEENNMSYPTHLMHLAEQIDPFIFCHYLQDNNWKVFERKRTDIRIYQMDTKTDFYQIIIPLDKKLSDYTQAMYEATETAASAENLPLEELIHLLLSKNCDTSADAPKNIR